MWRHWAVCDAFYLHVLLLPHFGSARTSRKWCAPLACCFCWSEAGVCRLAKLRHLSRKRGTASHVSLTKPRAIFVCSYSGLLRPVLPGIASLCRCVRLSHCCVHFLSTAVDKGVRARCCRRYFFLPFETLLLCCCLLFLCPSESAVFFLSDSVGAE